MQMTSVAKESHHSLPPNQQFFLSAKMNETQTVKFICMHCMYCREDWKVEGMISLVRYESQEEFPQRITQPSKDTNMNATLSILIDAHTLTRHAPIQLP